MKTIIHKAENRGHANHGWLNAKHSFSFASWFNPNKTHFGALRVLNDDEVAAGMGFGKHPHDNMEIITLVQEGSLAHQDSMGNGSVMQFNDVQVMSAGTGVFHSEMNPDKNKGVKLFQIWVIPEKFQVEPRYAQERFDEADRKNKWQQIIKPHDDNSGAGIFIYQQAWFNQVDLDATQEISYTKKRDGNGVYLMVIDGEITVDGQQLYKRDAIGITEFESFNIKANTQARVLAIDVPMITLE